MAIVRCANPSAVARPCSELRVASILEILRWLLRTMAIVAIDKTAAAKVHSKSADPRRRDERRCMVSRCLVIGTFGNLIENTVQTPAGMEIID